ncbi:hypothetical protein HGRIS_005649 [Hohenbuehelia grisea]|uniref:DUF6534 domain-containing protein n=1 Tax=Hohenbuehelia grisea TaxID=104357 RepID=A0ABR3JXG7_9AGAR
MSLNVCSTDAIINRIMAYVIHTGALTSIVECLVLAMSIRGPRDLDLKLIYLGIYLVVGNLYGNSMLAILNSRQSSRQPVAHSLSTFTKSTTVTVPMKFSESQTELAQDALKLGRDSSAFIHVETTHTVHRGRSSMASSESVC